MKKAISSLCSVVIMLTLVVCSFTASAASTESNKRAVFDFLTGEAGFNSAAACGIMANIEHESNFDPTTVARDSNGLLSGGLCMWNGPRFKNLQNYCYNNGYNYLSINGQLRFLVHELKTDYFKHIYNYIKGVSNDSSGAYNAAYYWCYYFEIPSNRASKACERGRKAANKYWPVYGGKTSSANSSQPALKLTCSANGKTVDIESSVSFSWTGGSSSVKNYYLYLKQPGQDKYTKISVNGSKKYTLSLKGRKTGKYKAYVIGKAANGNRTGSASEAVSFCVKCTDHNYQKTSVKKPTKTENGYTAYQCSKCSAVKKIVILSQNKQNLDKVAFGSLKVRTVSSNSVSLKWSAVNDADGYFVFQLVNQKWKLVKTLSNDQTSCTVSGLKANSAYKFLVRAYAGPASDKNRRVLSGYKTVNASTAPAAPVLSSITRPGEGQVALSWNKSSGADGYVVYYCNTLNGKYKKLADVKNKTSYTAKNLKSGDYIYLKVKAYNNTSSGTLYSNYSKIKYAKVL
ncbi:MAG: phage tail tip lysozyme [Acutalibacteraceae bacterium]